MRRSSRRPFKWQGSYGAFSASRWDVDRVVGYVKGQKAHHAAAELVGEWEEAFEEVMVGDGEGGRAQAAE